MTHPQQLERLYTEHHQAMTARLKRRYSQAWQRDLVEDAMSRAWLILDRKLTQDPGYIRDEETFSHWLFIVARNEINALMHQARQLVAVENPDELLGSMSTTTQTAGLAENRMELASILELLHGPELSHGRRQALACRMLGLTYEQAMQATGKTYTAVNRHTTEGRKAARELLV